LKTFTSKKRRQSCDALGFVKNIFLEINKTPKHADQELRHNRARKNYTSIKFHQYFKGSFCANIILPKNLKAKL